MASATHTGLLQLWPSAGGDPITLEKPNGAPAQGGGLQQTSLVLAWSPNGKLLAFSTHGQTSIRLWDPTNTRVPAKTLEGHESPLRSVSWSRDGARLASAADNGTIKVWDVNTGKVISDFTYFVRQNAGNGMAKPRASSTLSLSPDGKQLAVYGEDEKTIILDVDARTELKTLLGRPSNRDIHDVVCAVAWSPDGKRLATTSPDGTFLLRDTATWQEVLVLPPVLADPFHVHADRPGLGGSLEWSPDGRQLAFFSGSGSVTIWDGTWEAEK